MSPLTTSITTTHATTASTPDSTSRRHLVQEYEETAVPPQARRSLISVSAVWLGFPMILTCDQLVLAHFAPTVPGTDAGPAQIRWASFVAWAAGSAAALLAHSFAPWLSDAVIGILTAAAVYIGIRALTQRQALPQARQASGSRR